MTGLLGEVLVIFGLALGVIFVSRIFKVPTVVGLLLTGVLGGPHGLGLIRAAHEVEQLAELGVVFLLFTIGLEFSFSTLFRIRRLALIGGPIQVVGTASATAAIGAALGLPWNQAVFAGLLLSLSSTAIVLKIMQERSEIDSPSGRAGLGILIFQDLAAVVMIMLAPAMAGSAGGSRPWLVLAGKTALLLAVTVFLARVAVPRVLHLSARLRDRQVFMLLVITLGLGVAWFTAWLGLSLALGAFLAGLVISESEYSIDALGNVMPLRDLFMSFFFISVGMLLNLSYIALHPWLTLGCTLGVLLGKAGITTAAGLILRLPLRAALLVGLALAQVGEFAFVLAGAGRAGLLTDAGYQLFLGVSVITLIATPFIISAGPRLAELVLKLPWPESLRDGRPDVRRQARELNDHLIIAGFGPNGRALARAATAAGIPYIIMDLNPETVRREAARGEPICFCDAGRDSALEHAGVGHARIMVIAIPDPAATRMAITHARRLNPRLYIIARTNYAQEVEPLLKQGADEVIPAELEAAVEIFSRVLAKYLVPIDEAHKLAAQAREENYRMVRGIDRMTGEIGDVSRSIPDLEIQTVRVGPASEFAGRTIGEVGLRKKFGVTVAAVRRDETMIPDPGAETHIEEGDVLVLMGRPTALAAVSDQIEGSLR